MSVLVTPLPHGDALIMTKTLTIYLRYVQLLTITSETRNSHIVVYWKEKKENIYIDQLLEVREQLLELGLGTALW